ncbi:macrolide transporter subunit MacA [Acrocarpospora macrocephala]|uniref:Macrolide-specific efflux protein MacA n=1 Tax=Acrocarpospora macrocephala TaxID=150177 RepID=A0A5M3X4F1_9ACTN|nr:efflux RND transporter periplasmic adaptor subunit [Acrocarpospora macrocephala]GES13713.1 macrolide-specific efflux protein MacA [Acrocarpospora macrocephala]
MSSLVKLSTKRRALIVNLLLGGLLLGGVAAAYASLGSGSPAGAAPLTTPVTRGSVVASVSASGAVESARTRSLTFGTNGTVESIRVEPGDKVKKGAVLARLDDTAARESLEATKASLDAAEDADTSTASGYSQYINARNSYRAAKRALNATVIKAPYAGTVTAVNGTVGGSSGGSSGGTAGAGAQSDTSTGFIELADTTALRIVGQFTEADVTRLKVGQTATVTFDALTGVSASGKVTVIDPQPQTNNNVVQYAATVSLSEVPSTVRLGQTASVQVIIETVDDVLTLPSALITTAGGQSSVTLLNNGQQVRTRVEVGVKGDAATEIVSGLKEGDQVVRPTTTTTTGGGLQLPGGLGGGGLGGGGLVRGGGGQGGGSR